MLLQIIIATVLVSLISLVGLFIAGDKVKKYLKYFIAFATGTLIAASFFDLIPEALEKVPLGDGLSVVVFGILLFFLIETFLHWHHCGSDDSDKKPVGVLIFAGDFVHNFVDGLLIASAFLLDFSTGLLTTFIVMVHEIPQEVGDFSILIHSGYKKRQALKINFISALSAVIGGIVGFFIFDAVASLTPYAVLVAAGGFLYIALTDIIPELHGTKEGVKKIYESLIFIVTVVFMKFLLGFLHLH